jgi:hypothetical protein
MVALLLALVLPASGQGFGLRAGAGFHGYAGADLSSGGLKTLGVDSLFLFPSISVQDDGYHMKAVMRADPLTTESGFRVVHGSAGLRLPGSPWIGARAAYGPDSPFIFGLDRPWREWDNSGRDSLVSATLEGGGVLGFSGFYTTMCSGRADTLVWAGIRSPWLGFAQFWWDGMRGPEERNIFTGFMSFPGFSPWVSVGDSSGFYRADGELRGLYPLSNSEMSLMAVPFLHYSEDDRTSAGAKLLFAGRNTAQAGALIFRIPVQSRGPAGAELHYSMRSIAGIQWDTGLEWSEDDGFGSRVQGEYRSVPSGFGLGFVTLGDSIRVVGKAFYSPVPTVAAEAVLSTALFSDDLKPAGSIIVSAFRGPLSGLIGYTWEDGASKLKLELGGWMGL